MPDMDYAGSDVGYDDDSDYGQNPINRFLKVAGMGSVPATPDTGSVFARIRSAGLPDDSTVTSVVQPLRASIGCWRTERRGSVNGLA
jgi:hypothetical protein